MNRRFKSLTAITFVACSCLGLVRQGMACMDTISPPRALHLATPADLPANLTLNPGQRIEFAIPHLDNARVELMGDLKVLSKPGDTHLALGVSEDATHVDGEIRFLGSEEIYHRCTPVATKVHLVRQESPARSIREVSVDLTNAAGLEEWSRKPAKIDGHDLLKVTVTSDDPDVVVAANGRIWTPVRMAFDFERHIFTAWFRDSGLKDNPSDQPFEIGVKHFLDGSWQLEHFKVERMPTPTC